MIGRILAVAGIACCAATSAAAADAKQPTGKWNVDFDDAQCVATRNYGSDEDPLYLVVKAPPLGDVLKIAVVRKGQMALPNQVEGEIVFDDNPPVRTTLLESGVKELGHRVLSVNVPTPELAPMRTASRLRIRAREEGRPVVGSRVAVGMHRAAEEFALSQMAPLLKVVDECVADLRKVWNVSPADAPSPHLKQRASGDLQGVFRGDDYPAEAMDKNMEGEVQFALLIDETGAIADCTVIKTSGVAVLDAQSCGIVKKRARFKPALGHDGKPAKDGLVQRVSWRIAS
jgi:TonB family protein